MYDAVTSMGAGRAGASLLPSGHTLDLFVTLTDYYGYQQLVQIHDPPLIHELEHHHVLRFTYRRRPNGEVESDFELDNAPALAFAARATSSFPGAFPPARIVEMDELVAQRQAALAAARRSSSRRPSSTTCRPVSIRPRRPSSTARSSTTARSSRRSRRSTAGPPIARSIAGWSISSRIRRRRMAARAYDVPGFFATLRGAMSDIPSSQPVTDELSWVVDFNDRVRRLRAIIDSARPHVSQLVTKVVTSELRAADHDGRAARLARAGQLAGRARRGLRLSGLCAAQARLGARIRRRADREAARRSRRNRRSRAWSPRSSTPGRSPRASSTSAPTARRSNSRPQTAEHLPAWVNYLLAFDVKYRERRLHFLIEGQNRLYGLLDQERFAASIRWWSIGSSASSISRLDALRRREDAAYYSEEARELVAEIFPTEPSASEVKNLHDYARSFVRAHSGKIDRLIAQLSAPRSISTPPRAISTICWPRSIRPTGIRTRGARCWSTISASRSGTC